MYCLFGTVPRSSFKFFNYEDLFIKENSLILIAETNIIKMFDILEALNVLIMCMITQCLQNRCIQFALFDPKNLCLFLLY